jgi:hypothetical protein
MSLPGTPREARPILVLPSSRQAAARPNSVVADAPINHSSDHAVRATLGRQGRPRRPVLRESAQPPILATAWRPPRRSCHSSGRSIRARGRRSPRPAHRCDRQLTADTTRLSLGVHLRLGRHPGRHRRRQRSGAANGGSVGVGGSVSKQRQRRRQQTASAPATSNQLRASVPPTTTQRCRCGTPPGGVCCGRDVQRPRFGESVPTTAEDAESAERERWSEGRVITAVAGGFRLHELQPAFISQNGRSFGAALEEVRPAPTSTTIVGHQPLWKSVRSTDSVTEKGAPPRDVPGTTLCRYNDPTTERASHNVATGHSTGSAPHPGSPVYEAGRRSPEQRGRRRPNQPLERPRCSGDAGPPGAAQKAGADGHLQDPPDGDHYHTSDARIRLDSDRDLRNEKPNLESREAQALSGPTRRQLGLCLDICDRIFPFKRDPCLQITQRKVDGRRLVGQRGHVRC